MIIPMSDNECGRLICTLHGLAEKYTYIGCAKKEFPNLVDFFIEQDNYTLRQMTRSVSKELRASYNEIFYYRISIYRKILIAFKEYLINTYADIFPEILI